MIVMDAGIKREKQRSSTEAPAKGGAKKSKEQSAAKKTRSSSIERSLHIIEILVEAPAPMGIAAITRAAELEVNTAHRLLQRLVATGYVYRNAATKQYSAGLSALFPKSLYHPLNSLYQDTREQLRLLRETYYESVCLIIFLGYERVIIDFIQGREPLTPLYETRLTNPMHASAAGIILLNDLTRKERRQLLGDEPFKASTVNTVTNYEMLEKQFEALRTRGYTVAQEAAFIGVNAVAAPIRAQRKSIGCIAITGSSQTMTGDRLAVLGEALKDATNLVSRGAPSVRASEHFLGL